MRLRAYLLGFDVRLPEAETLRNWPMSRRRTYLLSDVPWPLSVDRSVWPSLFRFSTAVPAAVTDAIVIEPQTFLQEAIDLWDSRAAMEEVLAARDLRGSGAIPIAIELCHERHPAADDSWSFIAGSLPENDVPESWRIVGHDVADRDFLTGLSNCGYDERDRADLEGWENEINDFGLIDDLERARAFRAISDKRVPDHAPFLVVV